MRKYHRNAAPIYTNIVYLLPILVSYLYFYPYLSPKLKCGCADLRIFEVVKCGEILRILSADVMGKMQMSKYGFTTNELMPIAYPTYVWALSTEIAILNEAC